MADQSPDAQAPPDVNSALLSDPQRDGPDESMAGQTESTAPLGDAAIAARFEALDDWLVGHRDLWHPRPFTDPEVGWVQSFPEAAEWLLALNEERLEAFEPRYVAAGQVPDEQLPAAIGGWLQHAAQLCHVGAWRDDGRVSRQLAREGRLRWRVPGRKWQQVSDFAASLMSAGPMSPCLVDGSPGDIVDWCGGKGHLGRTLGVLSRRPVTVVEVDEGLRDEAEHLARRASAALTFAPQDALDVSAADHVGPDSMVVALHACGGLTNALIDTASARRARHVAVSTCCYHRAHPDGKGTTPLSIRGRSARLTLDHPTLRLSTADEVVAPPRLRRARRRENAWRQGVDLLLRRASGRAVYTPLGTIPLAVLSLPFEAFCHEIARGRGLRLPESWDPQAAEEAGVARAHAARALGQVRAIFRRPLELWLVLDRAMALQERGYHVAVAQFCPREMTPRNLLIRARRL